MTSGHSDPAAHDPTIVGTLLDHAVLAGGARSDGLPDNGAVVTETKLCCAITHDGAVLRARFGTLVAVSRLLRS